MTDLGDRRQGALLESSVRTSVPSAIDSWTILKRAKAEAPYPVYEPGDTHWTSRGSTMMVGALVAEIDPTLWDDALITYDANAIPRIADLTELIGLPVNAVPPNFSVVRPGVMTVETRSELIPEAILIAATGDDTIGGSTLVIFDSFGGRLLHDLSPFFSSTTWLDWRKFEENQAASERLAALILNYDRIVFEVAERESYRRIGTVLNDAIRRWIWPPSPEYQPAFRSTRKRH